MCYEINARPPLLPIAGGAVDSEDVVLTASDGNRFAALIARSQPGSTTGIVVLPDVRGLFTFYEELAHRFAEAGINGLAIDYFGRTAGAEKRGADFDWQSHIRQTSQENVAKDVRAAVEFLRSEAGGSCTSVFTIGFCFGGSNSWNQAAEGLGLAGAIGFYGRPGDGLVDGAPGPITRVDRMECPILALQAGADPIIPEAEVIEFRQALDAAGVPNEVVIYPNTPHSFFDKTYEQYETECADAWRRILGFIEKFTS